ncbi:succinate dehydrogenase, cytochrome b556 subunit [Teredinibacter haidensis]|uniref:succinate dehydrogenase, cytochrome b556 subunit n=1 Tax=Teredinibacter haidensis TaxID=2731755 RepID=UPI000948D6B5|nr:succinate dehydrogenase, cytochrome b556 subunit [Teredinibacter haidensis]
MKNNRPVNLDLSTIKFPVTAIVSILHRVSGVVLLAGVIVLLLMLDMSLSSEESYNQLADLLATLWAKLVLWGVLAALAYHFCAGVRHLIMDVGVGESLKGGRLGAKLALFFAIVLIICAGVWVW